jgi:hypothetical protein
MRSHSEQMCLIRDRTFDDEVDVGDRISGDGVNLGDYYQSNINRTEKSQPLDRENAR